MAWCSATSSGCTIVSYATKPAEPVQSVYVPNAPAGRSWPVADFISRYGQYFSCPSNCPGCTQTPVTGSPPSQPSPPAEGEPIPPAEKPVTGPPDPPTCSPDTGMTDGWLMLPDGPIRFSDHLMEPTVGLFTPSALRAPGSEGPTSNKAFTKHPEVWRDGDIVYAYHPGAGPGAVVFHPAEIREKRHMRSLDTGPVVISESVFLMLAGGNEERGISFSQHIGFGLLHEDEPLPRSGFALTWESGNPALFATDADAAEDNAGRTVRLGEVTHSLEAPDADKIKLYKADGTTEYVDAGGGGGSGELVEKEFTQSSHGLAVGAPVARNTSGAWVPATRSSGDLAAAGLVSEVVDANTLKVTSRGYVELTTGQWDARTGATGGLLPGRYYWLDTTAGMLTTTKPAAGIAQVILQAVTTTVALVIAGEALEVGDGIAAVRTVEEDDDITANDRYVFVDTTGGPVTVTLPSAVAGMVFTVKLIVTDDSATVACAEVDSIDGVGGGTVVLTDVGSVTLVARANGAWETM